MTFQNRHNVKCNVWILFVFVSEAEDKSPSLPGSRLQVENVPKFSVTNQQQNECNYSVNTDINNVIGNMFSNSIKKKQFTWCHVTLLSIVIVCEELRHRNKKLHTSQIKYSEDLFLRWLILDSFQWDSHRMAEMHNSKIFTCKYFQRMMYSQSSPGQADSFYQANGQDPGYYGSNPDLIPITNCELPHLIELGTNLREVSTITEKAPPSPS